jgi:hypothetical protein
MSVEKCLYCEQPAQGNYAIHENNNMEGLEYPLCNNCGEDIAITCECIWERVEKRKVQYRKFNVDPENRWKQIIS